MGPSFCSSYKLKKEIWIQDKTNVKNNRLEKLSLHEVFLEIAFDKVNTHDWEELSWKIQLRKQTIKHYDENEDIFFQWLFPKFPFYL